MYFVDEEFLHKKINNEDVYMWIMCDTEDIPEDVRRVRRQSGIMEIWQYWTEVGDYIFISFW